MNRRFGNAMTIRKGDGPVWNVIMPAGEWHRPDFPNGAIRCDAAFFEAIISNWRKVGSPGLPVDRFHWGSSDDTRVTDPSAKAAVGFIEDLRVGRDGNLEGLTRWNEDGRADIEADRFRYFSPTFHENWRDAATGELQGPTLFGGALLNDPYFKTLPRLAASDSQPTEKMMDRSKLLAAYGLPQNATDAEIEAAARRGAEAMQRSADAEEKRTAAEKRSGELTDDLKRARDANDAMEKRVAALESERLVEQTAALISRLEQEGRIRACEKTDVEEDVQAYGIKRASERWLKREPVVRLGERGVPGADSPADATKKLEAIADDIAKKEGVPLSEGMRRASRRNPELHKASLAANKRQAEA